jgi:hypothetical protein
MRRVMIVSVALLMAQGAVAGADEFLDNVRPFMRFFEDAALAQPGYAEGQFRYLSGDIDGFIIGAQGAYMLMPLFEAGGRVGFASLSNGESESGLMDPDFYARYLVVESPATKIAVGGLLNLPVGSDKILQGTFDFEGFGGLRYALPQIVVLGNFGFRMNGDLEINDVKQAEGKMSILFGGGLIYQVNPQVSILGELAFETEQYKNGDSLVQLTPGIDFELESGLKLRGALALGLSDAVPDFVLIAGVAMPFGG